MFYLFSNLDPIHTSVFSFENAYNSNMQGIIFHRKPIHLKKLLKMDQNAYMYISCISVDGPKKVKNSSKWKKMLQVCVCSMRIEFNLRHNMQLYCFWTF